MFVVVCGVCYFCVCVCVLCCVVAYLLVGGQGSEERDDVRLDIVQLQDLGKLSQLGGGGTAHHGRVV